MQGTDLSFVLFTFVIDFDGIKPLELDSLPPHVRELYVQPEQFLEDLVRARAFAHAIHTLWDTALYHCTNLKFGSSRRPLPSISVVMVCNVVSRTSHSSHGSITLHMGIIHN